MSLPFSGRRRPYTDAGIRRLRCTRCGAKATRQWSACANGNRHTPLCDRCDVELNELALRFMRLARAEELLAGYRAAVLGPRLSKMIGGVDAQQVVPYP